jgi:6-phosphogluconolactonase (cycloisomerase 2 family)
MDFPVALDVSPDGTSVYVVAKSDDAIARFRRDSTSGKLTYRGCVTGETESAAVCDAIPGAAAGGSNAGLNDPQAIDLSADGTSLYLAGLGDEAVVRFKRDTTSGKLTYKDCITGDTAAGPLGSGACDAIPSATSAGSASGLANPIDVALSADGASLYLAAQGDTAIARFSRDTGTGKLSYKDCITGETENGPAGSGACAAIPSAASLGDGSGLNSLHSAIVSPDGTSLYATASSDDAVARFERNTTSGKLSYKGCVTGDEGLAGVCRKIPPATLGGASSGLDTAGSAAMSSDGFSLYVASPFDDAVTVFARDTTTGKLVHQACVTGEVASGPTGSGACAAIPSAATSGTNSGLDNPQAVALSSDGSSLYLGTSADDSIARFSRTP